MSLDTDQSIKAFCLVIAAGAATSIGASVVFFPSLVKLANHKTLAASMGLSTGVMLYISLVDIYGKGISGFEQAGHDEGKAFIYTTLSFFLGIILMKLLHTGVAYLLHVDVNSKTDPKDQTSNSASPALASTTPMTSSSQLTPVDSSKQISGKEAFPAYDDDKNPVEALNEIHRMAKELTSGTSASEIAQEQLTPHPESPLQEALGTDETERKQLFIVGAATAAAIALHNFPEGLVTFVAYIEEPAVGVTLAIGIAVHNIPEGLCVAMPIFYATGDRWKAFLWAIFSGVSEPLGALLGWLVLKSSFSGNTYGIMFGVVAGIMVFICVDELLPTAYKHDPTASVTTPAILLGMLLLASSLMLFSV
eukprot:Nitzschia sp. Nitz4//scaffold314_size20990//11103//12286//NITZ4_008631-RA/size20990-augustus-gene-0.24-mRNA-1//1//CDS//3329547470//5122//frame0